MFQAPENIPSSAMLRYCLLWRITEADDVWLCYLALPIVPPGLNTTYTTAWAALPHLCVTLSKDDIKGIVSRVSAYEHCHAFGSSNFSNYPLIFRRGVKARRKRFAPG